MKYNHSFYQNSLCRNGYLHKFEIKEEYDEGVLEVCEVCNVRKFFKIINNEIDNQNYMSYHLKQIMPLDHPMYDRQNQEPMESKLILSPYARK